MPGPHWPPDRSGEEGAEPSAAESFFTPLLTRDASGREWLGRLLSAVPGAVRLGELRQSPGSLSMTLSVRGLSGRFGCFEYPVAPPAGLVRWFIDHPERLVWPQDAPMSPQTIRLRRALLSDDPPGSRARAQQRALELLGARSVLSQEWWRFEDLVALDCLLMTDRLLITVQSGDTGPAAPASPWYPPRSRLVRTIEAARELAGERRWGCLLIGEEPLGGADALLDDDALEAAAPHLDARARLELREAFLGSLTWQSAGAAVSRP